MRGKKFNKRTDIESNQVHRIVHRKNALIYLFLLCTKKQNPCKILIYRDFLCFAILSSGETGSITYHFKQYHKLVISC